MDWQIIDNSPLAVHVRQLNNEKAALWQRLKRDLPIGKVLSGNIFARIIYGVLFDAGLGCAVRMNVTDFGAIAEGRNYPHNYPKLGSEISGRFAGFDELDHQLVVIQIL